MNRSLVLLVAVSLALIAAAPAQAADRCALKGSKTLRQTSKLRLYVLQGAQDKFYVCVRANGRRFRADDRQSDMVTMLQTTLTSAGSYAAYGYTFYENEDTEGLRIVVLNLTTGKQTNYREAPTEFVNNAVPSLVLRSTGAAAWIAQEKPVQGDEAITRREVHSGKSGKIKTLDTGLEVEPRSLKLAGSTISWVKAGETKTASL
jgi:hypothetical protein